jgi:predicted KAP-like P-loop ATPase
VFDADRAIQKSDQDRLGRTTFAKYLARCILDHKSPESLVIGLHGGWGTGKTSIINLMLEELNFASSNMLDEEKPIILNFSPWSYSGQGQLIYAFFRRLSSVIRQAPYFENSEKIIQLLELYVSFFTHKPIPRALRTKKSWFSTMIHPLIARDNAYGWESGRDLTQVKAELNALLLNQKHKLIIIIDNISRIQGDEIKQIFQIVKSMGDYNNTVYFLSLDKEHVIHALSEGEEYLEKIVQLPFEVPAISNQDLENILLSRLKTVISLIAEETWDREYWADIYYSTLKYFFTSCRDITRYINTLSFGFERVKDVVNPVDFFALTALRVFEPDVFYGIRDNKDLFTDLISNVYQLENTKVTEDRLRSDEILNRATNFPSEMLLQLLMILFPRLKDIYQYTIPHYHSGALTRKNRRICSPDMFDIYFRLSIPSGYISDSEMDAILAATNSEEHFSQALLRLNQDDRITKFLDLLDGVAAIKVSEEHIGNVINALMDSGDLFPEGESSPVTFSTAMRVHRICHQLLRRLSSSQQRFALYQNAIKKAKNSLYIIIHELNEHAKEHTEDTNHYLPYEHRDFSPEQLEKLQRLAVENIRYWAELGRLSEHPKLLPILYAWKVWEKGDECANYVAEMTKIDRNLVAFLCAALKEPIDEAISKLEKSSNWEYALKNIDTFIPAHSLEPHVKELFEDGYFEKLREREQLAILIFLDLVKAETMKIIPNTSA